MTTYKADMHIHSCYSWDSKMKVRDIIKTMEGEYLEYLALTDHVEFGYEEPKSIIDNLKRREEEIDELQETTNIKLIKGIEISEPHHYKKEVENLLNNITDLDVILGSIHNLNFTNPRYLEKNKETLDLYLNHLMEMLTTDSPIDVVAHLDYIKRLFGHFNVDEYKLNEILSMIIDKDLTLEINTSGIRRCGSTFPDNDILNEYIRLGGSKVTIGSDAHEYQELYDQVNNTYNNIKTLKLTPGVIINHTFKSI